MKKGWEVKKLGEVCDTGAGGTPLKAHKDYYENGNIPWLLSGEVSQGEIYEAKNFITEKGLKNSSAKLFPPNTVLVAMYGATAGQVGILKFEACTNQAVCGILPNDKTIPEYLFYCFLSKKEELVAQAVGGAQPNISQIKIRNTKIPLPPLPEQQRIVAILDEAFAAIAKAKANAEQNLKNAKELFESYLQGVFENKGEGWEEKTLKDITTKIGSGATPKGGNESYKPEGISLIRSMNVHDFQFREKNLAFIDDIQAKGLNNVTLEEGDVLLNITGASVARCCVIPKEYLPARVNQHVSIIRAQKEIIDPVFLNLLLTSKFYKDQLLFTGEQGATRQAITKAQLEVFRISFPPLKTQQTIVRKLDALSAETKKLEAIYQQKIKDLEELKKSVLQKAFSGQLTSSVYQSVVVAKLIPLQKVEGISTTDLQAGITAIALKKHIQQNMQHTFHHVKAEKIVHIAEYILNIDLERNPVKDAAGPNDFPHAKKVESRAKKAGFYSVYRNGDYYDYQQGLSIDAVIQKTEKCLGEKTSLLSKLLDVLAPMTTQQAEIVATVYAAWNNLILNGNTINDEDIVIEARENWRKEKLKIPREKFFKAIEWMRKNEILVPKGNGKIVAAK